MSSIIVGSSVQFFIFIDFSSTEQISAVNANVGELMLYNPFWYS